MILKASRRAGSKQLSDHLLNTEQNEHVFVEEVRGFATNNLNEALQEIYVQAKANKRVKKFMYSVSINPPQDRAVSKKSLVEAADAIEERLELTGQPRVIVFHEKEGRRHAHVVFNLMDENLKVIKLDFDKEKLNKLSRELFLQHGWELPKGYQNKQECDPATYDLAEAHMAERQKLNPKEIKQRLQACWKQSDNLESFKRALSKEGYQLAKGDTKNIFMLLDMHGGLKALSRALSVPAKDIKAKLGEPEAMQSIDEAKQAVTQTQKAELIKAQAALEKRHNTQLVPLKTQLFDMKVAHRKARKALSRNHQKRQTVELKQRQKQFGSSFKKVWLFISGQSSTLKKKHMAAYEASLIRDEHEREALITAQLKERQALQQTLTAVKLQHQSHMLHVSIYNSKQSLSQGRDIEVRHQFDARSGQDLTQKPSQTQTQELEL